MEAHLLSIEKETKSFVQKHSSKSFFDFKVYGLLHSSGSATCGQDISDYMRDIMQQHFIETH